VPAQAAALAEAGVAGRVRKNVAKLGQTEIDKLKTAWNAIVAKPPSDATGYYALASIHGLPQAFCRHHEDRYNPWHRVYLKQLEDALRSVPGCQDVTLPYWDIKTPVPALLKSPPFDSYVVPVALPAPYGANYKTRRYNQATIDANLERRHVLPLYDSALIQSMWGVSGTSGFQNDSIAAHDGGHLAIGPTMAEQDVASYDPIFWFFHCNLDRHWLTWQTKVGATTLTGFKSTLEGNTDWLSPPFNELPPFTTTADQTIQFADISYDALVTTPGEAVAAMENRVGNIEAARAFRIRRSPQISIQVKDIDRLNIPGSFVLTLLADNQPVAHRAFFQPGRPRDCATCRKLGNVNINFKVDQEQVVDRKLSVTIEVPSQAETGRTFPLSQAGNPTINARLLMEDA
jgi:hypothetical protein